MMVLLAVILFLALATGESVLYRLTYFLTLATAGSYVWVRLSLWRLDVRVGKQSSVAQVGDVLTGAIYVRNNSGLSTGCVEVVQMSDMPCDVCGGIIQLSALRWREWETQRFCCARGIYTIGPVVARSSDPLGLFRVQIDGGDRVKMAIYPPVVELPSFRLPVRDSCGKQLIWPGPQTASSEACTVRGYYHGDSLNRIHWPSTARCGQLMSKEFDSGRSGDIWIVLDLEREIHKCTGMERTDEYAVAIAASLAHLALTEERPVGLIAHGDQEYLLPLGSGTRQMSRVLDMLALSKTEGDAPLANVLSDNAVILGRSDSLLIVTSSTATEWVSVLQDLVYRGLSIIVVLVDPMSFGGDQSCCDLLTTLVSAGIPVYVVRRGDSLPLALSRQMMLHDLPILEEPSTGELIPASEAS